MTEMGIIDALGLLRQEFACVGGRVLSITLDRRGTEALRDVLGAKASTVSCDGAGRGFARVDTVFGIEVRELESCSAP